VPSEIHMICTFVQPYRWHRNSEFRPWDKPSYSTFAPRTALCPRRLAYSLYEDGAQNYKLVTWLQIQLE